MKRILPIFVLTVLFGLGGCIHYGKTLQKGSETKRPVSLKARDHFLQGIYHQQEGRYSEALVEFYQALHFDSTSATIYATIAENYMRLGHYDTAELMLKKARQLDAFNPRILEMLAQVSLRLGKEDQAIRFYEELLRVSPYNRDARELLILLYEKKGDLQGVERQYRALLRLYGKDKDLLFKLVQVHVQNKDFDRATRDIRSILQIDSTESRAYYFLGLMAEKKLHSDSAVYFYKKALKYNPTFAQVLDRLSFLYRTQKKWQSLVNLYRYVLAHDSTYVPGKILMAEAYFYLEKYDSARAVLQPLMDIPDIPLGAIELLGRIELQTRRYQAAKTYFQKILERDPNSRIGLLFLAFAYSDMDSLQQAENTFKRRWKNFRTTPPSGRFTAMCYSNKKSTTRP